MLTRETVIVYGSWGKYEGELIRIDKHGVTLRRYLAWGKYEGELFLHTIDSGKTKIFWKDMDGICRPELRTSLLLAA